MTSTNPHDRKVKVDLSHEEDDDPVERHLRKVGCLDLHYKVQECMVDHKDWRVCKPQVNAFKACMAQANNSTSRITK